MNIVAAWLFMVGTPQNARKLRQRLDGLKPPPLDQMFGPEPRQCPLTVLYGAEVSRRCYLNAKLRPALDAWDSGYVTTDDLRRWCLEIERGRYTGPRLKTISAHGVLLQAVPISQASPSATDRLRTLPPSPATSPAS